MNRAGRLPRLMHCWDTRAQGSHRGRNERSGVAREWCGRRERSDRATVARRAGPRRASAVSFRVPSGTERERSGGPCRRQGWRTEHVWHNDGSSERAYSLPLHRPPFGVSARTAPGICAPVSRRLFPGWRWTPVRRQKKWATVEETVKVSAFHSLRGTAPFSCNRAGVRPSEHHGSAEAKVSRSRANAAKPCSMTGKHGSQSNFTH